VRQKSAKRQLGIIEGSPRVPNPTNQITPHRRIKRYEQREYLRKVFGAAFYKKLQKEEKQTQKK